MYFVRSGYIDPLLGLLLLAGYDSDFWASTAYPNYPQVAFDLSFGSTNAYPSNSNLRYNGFSLHHRTPY